MADNIIDLSKRAQIVLTKRSAPKIRCRVGFASDVSGSMRSHFNTGGPMQDMYDRLIAMALLFDSDGQLDSWTFADRFAVAPAACVANHQHYIELVKQAAADADDLWGGTSYAPVLRAIQSHYFPSAASAVVEQVTDTTKGLIASAAGALRSLFGRSTPQEPAPAPVVEQVPVLAEQEDPAFLVFGTDGDSFDEARAEQVLDELNHKPIYILFVGIGTGSKFTFLKSMADKYDNVGFIALADLPNVSADQLYEQILSDELIAWYKRNSKE